MALLCADPCAAGSGSLRGYSFRADPAATMCSRPIAGTRGASRGGNGSYHAPYYSPKYFTSSLCSFGRDSSAAAAYCSGRSAANTATTFSLSGCRSHIDAKHRFAIGRDSDFLDALRDSNRLWLCFLSLGLSHRSTLAGADDPAASCDAFASLWGVTAPSNLWRDWRDTVTVTQDQSSLSAGVTRRQAQACLRQPIAVDSL
jgi:hypothetical protein